MDTTNQSLDDSILLQIVQECDRQQVLKLLHKFFFSDEPLIGSTEPKGKVGVEEEDFLLATIQYGLSIKAVRKGTNEMIGICLAAPQGPDDAGLIAEAATLGGSKWGKIVALLACIEHDADVHKRYNIEKILHVVATCVDSSMRGKNVGARLYKAVGELGKAKGFQLLRADCSSYYSASIKERLGWDCVNTVYYKDYVDDDNKPVFSPPSPHVACISYALRL